MTEERRIDSLTPGLAARYAATFDREVRETGPQGIHWCLNTPEAPTALLGADGHPLRSDHADLPRRMWASSEVKFHTPIAVGAEVERISRIAESSEKVGKSGRLVFVTVAHEVRADGVLVVSERQNIVYREPAAPGASPSSSAPAVSAAVPEPAWEWIHALSPSPALLFRYSALTFNSHRIHYDLPYAREEEGYPGLVVHGPLMASLLLDLMDREFGPDRLASFAFRAVSPAFAGNPLRLCGRREGEAIALAVLGEDGRAHVTATATLNG